MVRDPYSHAYLREETDGVLVGPYETASAHRCWDGEPPAWDFESELVAPELDRLMPWLEKAAERLPLFGRSGMQAHCLGCHHAYAGRRLSVGPCTRARKNYWMHCGASIGICQGAGAGKYLAQWMVHGQADINMREFDPRRFGNWATKEYTEPVGGRRLPSHVLLLQAGRAARGGPRSAQILAARRLEKKGAQIQQVFGWERASLVRSRSREREAYSFRRSNWWEAVREEALGGARARRV